MTAELHPDADLARRWTAVMAHRERLLRLCRSRLANEQDAQDCVQEAMLRCVEFTDLDEGRLGAFLTTVTLRLCADHYRGYARRERLSRRLSAYRHEEPGPEEETCERAEAAWIADRLSALPVRQRDVVAARADGLSAAEAAARLNLSVASVNSALERARRTLRDSVAARWAGCSVAVQQQAERLSGFWRRPHAAGAAVSTAATLATLTALFPPVGPALPPPRQEAAPPAVRVIDRPVPATATVTTTVTVPKVHLAAPLPQQTPAAHLPGLARDPERPPPYVEAGPYNVGPDDDTPPEDIEHHKRRVLDCVEHGVHFEPWIGCRSAPPEPQPGGQDPPA